MADLASEKPAVTAEHLHDHSAGLSIENQHTHGQHVHKLHNLQAQMLNYGD